MVAVNIASLLARERELVLADLDVEAPNVHLLLNAKLENEEPVEIMLPFIDYKKCTGCGVCAKICDTGGIIMTREKMPMVLPRLCSGCRACYFACPEKAIVEGKRVEGYIYYTRVRLKDCEFTLVTGMLREGEEHTPPVVLPAKKKAISLSRDLLVIDTSAGTANHVSTALEGSKIALAVTEPTPLGLHDLELILKVLNELRIDAWVLVNRWGIGSSEKMYSIAEKIAKKHNAVIKAKIPYSRDLVEAYVRGIPIVEFYPDHEISKIFRSIAKEILDVV
ncbi:MAG: 4Fe-4S binding protein [Fervidicoccaceae archaeon]